jgi:hypothetical protein
MYKPTPVAAQSKAWICGRSLAGIASLNPAVVIDACLINVVCCQVEASAASWSLVQGSPTEYGVSECHLETSTMRRHRVHQECQAMKINCEFGHVFNKATLCDLSRRAGGSTPYILNFCTTLWRMVTFISWLLYLRGRALHTHWTGS